MTKKERVFNVYEWAINEIDDATEYRNERPEWLKVILDQMHKHIEAIQKS